MTDGRNADGDGEHREDSYLVVQSGSALLCAVCDGVGGGAFGHPAAELVISKLRASVAHLPSPDAVVQAIAEANLAILARSRTTQRSEAGDDVRWAGMGATVAVALFVRGRAHVAHVGDVRIYRLREADLEPLTQDHTLVNEYLRVRPELRDDLASIPQNVMVRALGMKDELEIDRREVTTSPGDVFVLCSHAVTATLGDAAIASILRHRESAATMSRALLDAVGAAPRAAKGNATAVVHMVSTNGV